MPALAVLFYTTITALELRVLPQPSMLNAYKNTVTTDILHGQTDVNNVTSAYVIRHSRVAGSDGANASNGRHIVNIRYCDISPISDLLY